MSETEGKRWLYPVKGMHEYKGVLCMPDSTPAVMRWMEQLQFNQGDVMMATYGDSGIYWAQEALWHIYHPEMVNVDKDLHLGFRVVFIEHTHMGREPTNIIAGRRSPRIFKTGLPAPWFTDRIREGKVKVVVWTMNPKNALLKHHVLYNTKGRYAGLPPIEWNEFYELFRNDQLFYGSWFENVPTYTSLVDLPNVLLMKYEDAAMDPAAAVKKMADFCQRPLTPEQVEQIAGVLPVDDSLDWRSGFTEEQLTHFNSVYDTKMNDCLLRDFYRDNSLLLA